MLYSSLSIVFLWQEKNNLYFGNQDSLLQTKLAIEHSIHSTKGWIPVSTCLFAFQSFTDGLKRKSPGVEKISKRSISSERLLL